MIEAIKRVVAEMLNMQARTQYGTISAYNPNTYAVKVLLQPEGVETGWIPLAAPWVGNGLGAVFGPPIGTDCRVDFVGGVPEAALGGSRFFNASNPPPLVQSGQGAIVDAGGSYVRLNGDGTITLGASVGITSTTPLLTQDGDLLVTGNISDVNGAHGTLADLRNAHNKHAHGGVQTGGGSTGTPSITV